MSFDQSKIIRANELNPIADLYGRFNCGTLRREGSNLAGPCPFHGGDSFKLFDDGKAKCFGCGWTGDSVDFYREHTGRSLPDALADLVGGDVAGSTYQAPPRDRQKEAREERARLAKERRTHEECLKAWGEAETLVVPGDGGLGEGYFKARGITAPLPPTLRFHGGLKHYSTGLVLPAIIGLVSVWPVRKLSGIHRTFLRMDGQAKAPVSKAKMMLGKCTGGAVRLAPITGNTLALCEGIETGLSVYQMSGDSPATRWPVWACLSTSGLIGVTVPDEVQNVIIAADHDKLKTIEKGPRKGHTFRPGHEAAEAKAEALTRAGKSVKIIYPDLEGDDFNDELNRNIS